MGITTLFKRIEWYHKKYGWAKLMKRTLIELRDRIDKRRYLNFLELHNLEVDSTWRQAGLTVACYKKESDIPANDIEQLIKLKSRLILFPFLNRYFQRGATLWLAKKNEDIASLIWSLNGGFNGFYEGLPISPNDSIIFAGETFPQFRGRGYFGTMIMLISEKLKLAGVSRVYVAVSFHNDAGINAQAKVLNRIGAVRYFRLGDYHIAIWARKSLTGNFIKY
jgi:hypothetical protein